VIAYTPSGTSGDFDRWTGVPIGQPSTPATVRTGVADAAYFGIEVQNNLMALIKGAVSSPFYGRSWTCLSGLATGDPVRISDSGTIALAEASGSGTSDVFGFVRDKGTGSVTGWVCHYWQITGGSVSGGTTGAPIYLTDTGKYSGTAGTFSKILGVFDSATGGLLHATPGAGIVFSGDPTGVGTGTADSGTLNKSARVDHVHKMRTGWDDIIIPIEATSKTGANIPTYQLIGGGGTVVRAWAFAVNDEVFFSVELPPSYKSGTDLKAHIHWMGDTDSGSSGSTCAFEITKQWRAMTGEAWTISGTGEVTMTGSGSETGAYVSRYTDLGDLSGAGMEIGSLICGRVARVTNGAVDYTGNVYILELGLHYQMDSFGSLNETSKT